MPHEKHDRDHQLPERRHSARDLTGIAVSVDSQLEVGIRLTKAFGFHPV